jgi:hypothetical protein
VGVGISRREVLVHRTHELGRGFGETGGQLFEHHLRLSEIAGLFAEHLDESMRVEVEQVAEQVV